MSFARWILPGPDPASVARIQDLVGCPEPIARLLAARNVADPQRFLAPTLDDLHEPGLMLGMAAAVARIRRAVQLGEPILIYGDYDVDGTTATVLLKTAIERTADPARPAIVNYHVPHRLREGYGIQNVRLAEAATAGVRLVISVDTGIRAFAAATEAKALGLDLIVTDHHLPDGVEGLPEALAVINPAQPGCPYPNKNLCGAGVAFKLAHALLAAHAATESARERLQAAILPSFLKLVAIATIADSVELTGENRAIVWLGLRQLANPVQPGLRALMQVARLPLDQPPTAREVGFALAPRINAAGRMDIASDVVELFLTRNPERASQLAAKLDALNQDRRASEAAALEAIELQLLSLRDSHGGYAPECIVLDHPEWHRGVIGILASRVVDRTRRPALVMTSEDGQAHGSGRSVAGYHLLDALTASHAVAPDPLFTRFGGHAHAVGFSLPADRLGLLRERMKTHSSSRLTAEMLCPQIVCDLELAASDLCLELLRWIERCAPFGMGNPEPVFVTRGLTLASPPRVIKEKHVCLPLTARADGKPLSAMGWSRAGQTPWPERVAQDNLTRGSVIDILYRLRLNQHPTYGGLELEVIDLATGEISSAV
jgi:single-stranded-DNA-specific exonuclease